MNSTWQANSDANMLTLAMIKDVASLTVEAVAAEWCQNRSGPKGTAESGGICAAAHTATVLRHPGSALPLERCTAERMKQH